MYKVEMKGFPKVFKTVFDYRYILENYPEWRERTLEKLREIHDLQDEKATIATHLKEPLPLFSLKALDVEQDLDLGKVNKKLREEIDRVITGVPSELEAENDLATNGWLLKEKGSQPIHAVVLRKSGADVKCFLTTQLEEDEWETEEIDNPLPLWKQKGFKTRAAVKTLIDEFSGGVTPEPIGEI